MDTNELIRTQKELTELIGCPGREGEISAYIAGRLRATVEDLRIDALGNVLAVMPGRGRGPRVLLDAHMDEVGFLVNAIEPNGFLRLAALGGIDQAVLPGLVLAVRCRDGARVHGVISSLPPHVTRASERGRVSELSDMALDIGASSEAEVDALGIEVGSTVAFDTTFRQQEELVFGKAFDDRSGCNILIHILESLAGDSAEATVIAAFTVQEEVGARGAGPAVLAVKPDVALVVENTTATDTPGVPAAKVVTRMGAGPAISLADRGLIVPEWLVSRLQTVAADAEIGIQVKRPVFGNTNGSRIAYAGVGVPTAVVSVPCRYIHAPTSMMRIQDLAATLDLVEAFVRSDWGETPVGAGASQRGVTRGAVDSG
jgi:endoglucanase